MVAKPELAAPIDTALSIVRRSIFWYNRLRSYLYHNIRTHKTIRSSIDILSKFFQDSVVHISKYGYHSILIGIANHK